MAAPGRHQTGHLCLVVVDTDAVQSRVQDGPNPRHCQGGFRNVGGQHNLPLVRGDRIQGPSVCLLFQGRVHEDDVRLRHVRVELPALENPVLELFFQLHHLIQARQEDQDHLDLTVIEPADQVRGCGCQLLAESREQIRLSPWGLLLQMARQRLREVQAAHDVREVLCLPKEVRHFERCAARQGDAGKLGFAGRWQQHRPEELAEGLLQRGRHHHHALPQRPWP
mmetsp:Transcript_37752/g.90281  ORF Transcript_37752/g.90281 Transcript_37752/m.90281 type:complete len:224 (-) Transcript_37752:783-1454(-)